LSPLYHTTLKMKFKYPFSEYIDKINWSFLSDNPNVISLLEQNFDKIDWHFLSQNSNAIHILEEI